MKRPIVKLVMKMLFVSMLVVMVSACGDQSTGVVKESFELTEITADGFVRGKKTEGTGEGIYYEKEFLESYTFRDLQVGDKVTLMWFEEDYINENWDNVQGVE